MINSTSPSTDDLNKSSSMINTFIIIGISTILLLMIYKLIKGKSGENKKNTILIIGPSQSGKTTFFYYLINNSEIQSVVSMQPNDIKSQKVSFLKNVYDIMDIPGQGIFNYFIFL